MTQSAKVPVKAEQKPEAKTAVPHVWHPFETLRREVDRLFDDFGAEFWRSPFRHSLFDMEPIFHRELTVSTLKSRANAIGDTSNRHGRPSSRPNPFGVDGLTTPALPTHNPLVQYLNGELFAPRLVLLGSRFEPAPCAAR